MIAVLGGAADAGPSIMQMRLLDAGLRDAGLDSKHAIIPHQQFAYITGKNASDIALVINAMDLLHSGRFDGFCLVSSDSDFARLASRVREQGLDVYGFGEQKTPESFRQACRRFIYTENLLPGAAALDPDAASPAKPLEPPNAAIPVLNRVISQMDSEDGWVDLATVGRRLSNLALDFDPRTYGFGKLSDLVRNHSKCIRALRSPPGWFCLGAIAPLSLFVACHAYREERSQGA